MNDMYDATLC